MHKETEDFIKKYFGDDKQIIDLFVANKIDTYILKELSFYNTNKKDIKQSYVQYQFALKNKIILNYKSFYDELLKIVIVPVPVNKVADEVTVKKTNTNTKTFNIPKKGTVTLTPIIKKVNK